MRSGRRGPLVNLSIGVLAAVGFVLAGCGGGNGGELADSGSPGDDTGSQTDRDTGSQTDRDTGTSSDRDTGVGSDTSGQDTGMAMEDTQTSGDTSSGSDTNGSSDTGSTGMEDTNGGGSSTTAVIANGGLSADSSSYTVVSFDGSSISNKSTTSFGSGGLSLVDAPNRVFLLASKSAKVGVLDKQNDLQQTDTFTVDTSSQYSNVPSAGAYLASNKTLYYEKENAVGSWKNGSKSTTYDLTEGYEFIDSVTVSEMVGDGQYLLVFVVPQAGGPRPSSTTELAVIDTNDGSFVDFDSSKDGIQFKDLSGGQTRIQSVKNAVPLPTGDIAIGHASGGSAGISHIFTLESGGSGSYSLAADPIAGKSDIGASLINFDMIDAKSGVFTAVDLDGSGGSFASHFANSSGSVQTTKFDGLHNPAFAGVAVGPAGSYAWVGDVGQHKDGMEVAPSSVTIFDTSSHSKVTSFQPSQDLDPADILVF